MLLQTPERLFISYFHLPTRRWALTANFKLNLFISMQMRASVCACVCTYMCVCVCTLFILTTGSPACGPSVKINQKRQISGKPCAVSLCVSMCACLCECVCAWACVYFPLSAVGSYSNQYVSCLHRSGPDKPLSSVVSPQQMQQEDIGAPCKKKRRKKKTEKKERMRKEGGGPQDERATCQAALLYKCSGR